MALAYAIKKRGNIGDFTVRLVDVTLDNSYVGPGGWTLVPQQLGLGLNGQVLAAFPTGVPAGYQLYYNPATVKLEARQGDNANAAAAPGVELANASAVLSGVVVRLLVFGVGTG